MSAFAAFVLRNRVWVLLAIAIITVAFGLQIPNLRVNSDVLDSLPDTDPDAVLLKEIGDRFGGNRVGMIILETDDIFQPEVIRHVLQVTDTLKKLESISAVTSLTTMVDIRNDEYGFEVGTLVDEYDLPETQAQLDRLKERVFAKEAYKGTIVSEDGTSTVVIFSLTQDAVIEEVSDYVLTKTQEMNLPETLYYAGTPMLVSSIGNIISSDMKLLIPITFLIIGTILYLGFRSIRGLFVPLLTAVLAIAWTVGLMAWTDNEMSMISSNIPILLVAIGSAYSIHVINRIRQAEVQGGAHTLRLALTYITIPVFLAAVTTAIGFVSFIFGAYLSMIKTYGIFTALGTLFSCLLSLTFVPAVVSYTRKRRTEEVPDEDESFLKTKILEPLNDLLFNHARYVLVFWGGLILLSIWGIFLIKREVDLKEYFEKGNPTRVAEEIMVEKFGGTKPIFIHFKGDVQDPDLLRAMAETEAYMKESDDIYTTQSVAGLIMDMNEAIGEGRRIPQDRSQIEQLWFLLDGNQYLKSFVTDDLDEAIIVSKFISTDNASKIAFDDYMTDFLESYESESFEIQMTGMPFVDVTLDRSLVNSQIASLCLALVFVVIIVGMILKSFKLGIYATIPIAAAILILFGVMGLFGIPLNIGTVLVASVAVGIGIDYSIHMISHFKTAVRQGHGAHTAIRDAVQLSGRAIIINVASVSSGFLILVFSQMMPLQYFGFFGCH